MTEAGAITKAWRNARSQGLCDDCGWSHPDGDHSDDVMQRFFDEGVRRSEVVVSGLTACGSLVEYSDGSIAMYSNDGHHDEFMRVMRGDSLRAARAAAGW